VRTAALTTLALLAFAANSVLCRVALHAGAIDPASFSTIRSGAGAATLAVILPFSKGQAPASGSWASAAVLFLYAVPFAFAYTTLTAGTGALILFGAVQLTMVGAALASGERPKLHQWLGLAMALGGLLLLVLPGVEAPSPAGAAMMATAGVAWGAYSLRGRGSRNPLAQTAANFARLVPLVLSVSVLSLGQLHLEARGVALALASGALASGAGYVVWYEALRGLTATRAAVVQLAVPVLAAAGGVLFLSERVTIRLAVASGLVLGGIALALRPGPQTPGPSAGSLEQRPAVISGKALEGR
jgi:drug/metabolite transporter (DMT)-like permease